LKSITAGSTEAPKVAVDTNGKKPKTEKTIKQIQKNTLYTVKIRGIAFKHKKKDIKQFFSATKPKSIRLCPKVKGIAYVGFNTEKEMKQAINKNKSFLGKYFTIYNVKFEQN
jgi:multiple RNA-binding domain-containing protein 1